MWIIREGKAIMSNIEISEAETRKLQRISLKMVKYFDSVCRENKLTYFLCGGCCIYLSNTSLYDNNRILMYGTAKERQSGLFDGLFK